MSKTKGWYLKCEVRCGLPVVNLYRKIIMTEVGCFKLEVDQYRSDDVFLIREFLEQRVRQIPVNYDMKYVQVVLDVKNTIDQEMSVTTDHLRVQVGDKQTSAVKAGLCGKYLICKLNPDKTLYMTMKMNYGQPKENDYFRCCMFVATDPSPRQEVLTHDRQVSKIEMQTFGVLPRDSFLRDQVVSQRINKIITDHVQDVSASYSDQYIYIKFGGLPHYIVDPVLCYALKDLQKIGNQIQINSYLNAIAIGTDYLVREQDLYSLYQLVTRHIQQLAQDINELEKQIISSVHNDQ